MIRLKLSILTLLLLINLINLSAQIWPYSPMIRLGNSVYYEIDSLSQEKITGTNLTFDNEVTNRFFDITCKSDSIGLIINNSKKYFKQKQRKTPRCYKEILFYSRRPLVNSQMKIKYLKLIELNDTSLIAEATIKQIKTYGKKKIKSKIIIDREDLYGVFLGNGPFSRGFSTGTVYGLSLPLLLIFILE